MSLGDNLKAPFLSMGSLVTIVLVALLFGVFRLSEGKVSIDSIRDGAVVPSNREIREVRPAPSSYQRPSAPPFSGREFEAPREAAPAREQSGSGKNEPKSLDEIESALGLK